MSDTFPFIFTKINEDEIPEGEDIIKEAVYFVIRKDKQVFDLYVSTKEGDRLVPFSGNTRSKAGFLTDLFRGHTR